MDAWESQLVEPALVADLGALDADTAAAIGRWGEALVAKSLRYTLPQTPVTWENEEEEKGLPWDIVLGDLHAQGGGHFIEVKTTVGDSGTAFEMSLAELDCARQKRVDVLLNHPVRPRPARQPRLGIIDRGAAVGSVAPRAHIESGIQVVGENDVDTARLTARAS